VILVAGAVTFSLGFLFVCLVVPAESQPRWAALLLRGTLAVGAGIGLTSFLYFPLILAGAASPAVVIALDLAAAAACGLALRRRGSSAPPFDREMPVRPGVALPAAIATLASLLLLTPAIAARASGHPHGNWDAWSMWNVRAKYLAGPGDTWRNAVSPELIDKHSDYPLMLPAFIARTWEIAGSTSTLVPTVTGLVFFAAVLALVAATLALTRGTVAALVAALVLLANASYIGEATAQYADIPISFYYLATLALVILAGEPGTARIRLLAAAGVFASMAAWTKDEGLVFSAVCLAALLVVEGRRSGIRGWLPVICGAAPGLMIVLYFKLAVAPRIATPLGTQSATQLVGKLVDWSRHARSLEAIAGEAGWLGEGATHPLVLLGILAVTLRFRVEPERRGRVIFCGSVLAAMSAAYYLVYATTQADLGWLLSTTLARIGCQLWPAFLLTIFLALKPADQAPRH